MLLGEASVPLTHSSYLFCSISVYSSGFQFLISKILGLQSSLYVNCSYGEVAPFLVYNSGTWAKLSYPLRGLVGLLVCSSLREVLIHCSVFLLCKCRKGFHSCEAKNLSWLKQSWAAEHLGKKRPLIFGPRNEVGDFISPAATRISWRNLFLVVSPPESFGRQPMNKLH